MTEAQPSPQLVDRETWQNQTAQYHGVGETALSNIIEPLGLHNLGDPTLVYNALTYELFLRDDDDVAAEAIAQRVQAIKKANKAKLPDSFDQPPETIELPDIPSLVVQDPEVKNYISNRDLTPQNEALIKAWPEFISDYKDGLERGIKLGYIPAFVKDRLSDAFAKTRVRVVEAAAMSLVGPTTNAYYRANDDSVGVRHNSSDTSEHLTHEFTHKTSGGTFKHVADQAAEPNLSPYQRLRIGYSSISNKDTLIRTGLNEAVTEHITLGILTGDFETFDPDQRADGNNIYYDFRKIYATAIKRSQGIIDVKTVTNGFYEDTESQGNISARRKFVGEFVDAYGVGALNKLEKLCEACDIVNQEKLDEVILSRIHAPEIDADGKVVKKGSIDMDNWPTFDSLYSVPESSVA